VIKKKAGIFFNHADIKRILEEKLKAAGRIFEIAGNMAYRYFSLRSK